MSGFLNTESNEGLISKKTISFMPLNVVSGFDIPRYISVTGVPVLFTFSSCSPLVPFEERSTFASIVP